MKEHTIETVYKYTLRNGKLCVRKGSVMMTRFHYRVQFEGVYGSQRLPSEETFGTVQKDGPSIWLTERNDELARQTFIEYEKECLVNLQKQINKKLELIETLRKGL